MALLDFIAVNYKVLRFLTSFNDYAQQYLETINFSAPLNFAQFRALYFCAATKFICSRTNKFRALTKLKMSLRYAF